MKGRPRKFENMNDEQLRKALHRYIGELFHRHEMMVERCRELETRLRKLEGS